MLSIDEHLFDKFGWVAFSKDLGLKGHRELWLSIVRYVDDIFIATRWFCPDCVPHIVSLIYSKTVNFDAANEGRIDLNGFRVVKFLDLWTYMSWDHTFYALVHKNDLFVFSGLVSQKTKNRYPIPFGDSSLLSRRLVCDFQGMIARYGQLNFSPDEVYMYPHS